MCQRWLIKDYENMKPEQRLHFHREIAKASTERDKSIKELKLDERPNPWDYQKTNVL